mgnify:CR=1 FL=1
MASIRTRSGKWQVQIRRQGSPNITKSFIKKSDATAWARQMEAAADRHELPIDPRVLTQTTVGDLIVRYRDTVNAVSLCGGCMLCFLTIRSMSLPVARIREIRPLKTTLKRGLQSTAPSLTEALDTKALRGNWHKITPQDGR